MKTTSAIFVTLVLLLLAMLANGCSTTQKALPCPKMQQKSYNAQQSYSPTHDAKAECAKFNRKPGQ